MAEVAMSLAFARLSREDVEVISDEGRSQLNV